MTIENLVKDKSVCLVGAGVVPDDLGEEINSFDIVIRTNTIPDLNDASVSKKIGSKTNVIYYDGSFSQDRLSSYSTVDPSFVRCVYPQGEWFFNSRIKPSTSIMKNHFNFSIVDNCVYFELKKLCKDTRPNTGVIAVFDLLKTKLSKLFVVGIDCYRSSHPEYQKSSVHYQSLKSIKKLFTKGDNGDYHDPDIGYNLLKNILKNDSRLSFPDYILKMFNNPSLDSFFDNI